MPYKLIQVEINDEVATLTLKRPDKLNCLNAPILHEMSKALGKLNTDDGIKALILTGEGRAFCSGADLAERPLGTDKNQPGISRAEHTTPFVSFGWVVKHIEDFTKPVIAAVNGMAAGGGLALALAADIRIASENAAFSAIFVKRGLVPDCGVSYYLPRLVGVSKALEMMWTGEKIDAREAERIGLVNKVVLQQDLMKTAFEFAQSLAKGPSLAIEMIKRMAYTALKSDSVMTQMAVENFMQQVCMESEDVKEGVMGFLEKRQPKFTGR
ncbi:MAG: enoyl-CoA hydratase/isomerase family protein [Dehalococcoidia bacterium]|nr:enoyl-CoA hydratase/isomerase family protein [Dehalococcoidia bacterium]